MLPSLALGLTSQEETIKANVKYLEKQGLPAPGSGIQLVDIKELGMPEWMLQKSKEQDKKFNELGYINESSDRAYELLHFEQVIEKSKPFTEKMHQPHESHLRPNKNELIMSYEYRGVPLQLVKQYLGIAPTGTYLTEPKMGWTGAVEFFKTDFGACAYTENDLSHGGVRIAKDKVTYLINEKITTSFIRGNESTGYLYKISWYEAKLIHELECANQEYSKDLFNSTVEFAKLIDNSII